MENPDKAKLELLYVEQRKSLAEIGRLYGVHKNQVRRWLLQAAIPTRSVSEGTSIAQKGKPISEKKRQALSKNVVVARAHITEESRRKQAETRKAGKYPAWNKGQPMREETRQKLIAQRADPEYRLMMSERFMGEKSPSWKGGIKPEHSARLDRAEWRRLRQEIYERDNWTCQDCGCRCLNISDAKKHPKRKIQCHHVVRRRDGGLDVPSNLVTLCMSCHHKRERRYEGALFA